MDSQVPPFTPDEVDAMFQMAMSRGTRPDMDTCADVARLLCRWQKGGDLLAIHLARRSPATEVDADAARRRDRWDKAAGTLRTLMKQRRAEMKTVGRWPVAMELAMLELEASLARSQDWFGSERAPASSGKVWHRPAFHIMDMAVGVVSWFRPKQAGTGRKSSAAHFTELAVKRLGLGLAPADGEREAIAMMFERWTKMQGKAVKTSADDHKA